MTRSTKRHPHPWDLLADLIAALGVDKLNELPGLWEHQVDDRWKIFVNPHREPRRIHNVDLAPMTMYVEFEGLSWGLSGLAPDSSYVVENLSPEATPDAFEAAIRAAIASRTMLP